MGNSNRMIGSSADSTDMAYRYGQRPATSTSPSSKGGGFGQSTPETEAARADQETELQRLALQRLAAGDFSDISDSATLAIQEPALHD